MNRNDTDWFDPPRRYQRVVDPQAHAYQAHVTPRGEPKSLFKMSLGLYSAHAAPKKNPVNTAMLSCFGFA